MKMRKTSAPPPGKPAGMKMGSPGWAAAPYVAWLVLFAVLALITGAHWLLVFAFGGVVHLAGARGWEHCGAHRPGSRAALRREGRHAGPATMAELYQHLSLRAVRRSAARLRPILRSTWRLPAHEAGVHLGTAKRSAR